jgi:hypothetical protein
VHMELMYFPKELDLRFCRDQEGFKETMIGVTLAS